MVVLCTGHHIHGKRKLQFLLLSEDKIQLNFSRKMLNLKV